jgi:hypothetical protein
MQVNSAQDYLTMKKRQLIAKSYYTTPPPQSKKYNYVYTAVAANNATQRQRFIIPTQPGAGATYENWCCGTSGVPGVFSVVNTKNIQLVRDIKMPMSFT